MATTESLVPFPALPLRQCSRQEAIRDQAGRTQRLYNFYAFVHAHSSISRIILLLLLSGTVISLAETQLFRVLQIMLYL